MIIPKQVQKNIVSCLHSIHEGVEKSTIQHILAWDDDDDRPLCGVCKRNAISTERD